MSKDKKEYAKKTGLKDRLEFMQANRDKMSVKEIMNTLDISVRSYSRYNQILNKTYGKVKAQNKIERLAANTKQDKYKKEKRKLYQFITIAEATPERWNNCK
jgi:hypothetical protein